MSQNLKCVNLGCGLMAHEGWINVDGSMNAWFANHPTIATVLRPVIGSGWKSWPRGIVRAPLERRLPFEDESIDVVYTSHFVEHLTADEGATVVGEVQRVLKKSGVFRIAVPDLEGAARLYVQELDHGNPDAAAAFLTTTSLCKKSRPSPKRIRDWKSFWYDYQRHYWMYDQHSMKKLLESFQFTEIESMPAKTSNRIADIAEIERNEAVGPNGRGFALEAVKHAE